VVRAVTSLRIEPHCIADRRIRAKAGEKAHVRVSNLHAHLRVRLAWPGIVTLTQDWSDTLDYGASLIPLTGHVSVKATIVTIRPVNRTRAYEAIRFRT
jgi:hypothetical protein